MSRTLRMLDANELAAIIAGIQFPPRPKIDDIKILEREDWAGDEILDVFLILDEASPPEDWKLPALLPIYAMIRSAIAAAGDSRFVIFAIGTKTDYDERYTYDPSSED